MDFTGLSQPLAGAQGRQAWGGGARMFCFASRFLTATQHFPPNQGARHLCFFLDIPIRRAGKPDFFARQKDGRASIYQTPHRPPRDQHVGRPPAEEAA